MFYTQSTAKGRIGPKLLLPSSAFRCRYGHAMDVLDEFGRRLKFLLGSPTACPGSQPQMATGVFFRVYGLDSFVESVLAGSWTPVQHSLIGVRQPEAVHKGETSAVASSQALLPQVIL